ncbi:MAG: biotin/lipoyl-binding protein, partial [Armatimonadetes bacterium]|nr:biotin/lipoyl-binding protein [Armatimonadota bacterium]
MKKKIILVILLLSLGIFYYFYYLNKHNNSKIIKISGSIETTEIDLSFQIFGKIKNIFIDEGDKIKNGQILAELDKQELSAQKEKIKDALKVIISRLPDLKTKLKFQEENTFNKILLAKSGLNEAQYNLNELQNGFRTQEIKQIEAGFLQEETNLKKTKNDYKRGKELFKEGFISEQNLESLKTNYETSLYQYQQAKERLSLFLEGTRKEELKKAEEKVIQSKLNLNLAQNQLL